MQRGWIKGLQRLLEGARSAPVCGGQLPAADHRTADQRRPADGAGTVKYLCGKNVTLSTYFYNDAKLPAAVINLSEGDKQQQVLAYEAPSASGARYEGQNLTFFTKGTTPRWSVTASQPSPAWKIRPRAEAHGGGSSCRPTLTR